MTKPFLLRTTFAALSTGLALTACHKRPEPPPAASLPTVPVRVQTVEIKKHLATEEVVGTVRAKLRASMEAKISGRIATMPVVAGQVVKAGDLLAQLDAREIQARLDQAQAVLDQTTRDRERFQKLLQQKAVTQQEFDTVESRFRVAEAAVSEAQTMLGYTLVTAPFNGVVSRKFADVGDLASPGRPLLELEDPQALQLEADVPEALIGHVQLGRRMSVRIGALPDVLDGRVSEIAPVADPNSRTFRVKLDLPSGASLRAGLFGRVAVPVGESTAARVPAAAVVVRGQMELVFVVANEMAHLRLVKTGKRLEDDLEILSGLNPGERIVVDGAAALRDRQPVQVKP